MVGEQVDQDPAGRGPAEATSMPTSAQDNSSMVIARSRANVP
ncbi:hypothetical protein [Saccharothrix sp. S26]|nr:hypothetical protein [Saccharothrix sp. S26]